MLPLSAHINPANDQNCPQIWNGAQKWPGLRVHTHWLRDFRCKFHEEKRGALCGHFGMGAAWQLLASPSLQLLAILTQLLTDWQAHGGKHLTRPALRRCSVDDVACPALLPVGQGACPHLWLSHLRVSPTLWRNFCTQTLGVCL